MQKKSPPVKKQLEKKRKSNIIDLVYGLFKNKK